MAAIRPARRAIFATALLVISLTPTAIGASAATETTSLRADANVDLARALSGDGTFVGADDTAGAVDMKKWTLVSDIRAGEPPRFAPSLNATTANGWSNLGTNGSGNGALNSFVYAAVLLGTDLYVGGNFYQGLPNSTSLDFLAKWNGSSWSSVGSNGSGGPAINAPVYALFLWNSKVLVGGDFTNAGGDPQADELAVWDPSVPLWSDIANASSGSDPFNFGEVHAISAYGSNVYLGGYWFNSPATPVTVSNPGDMILRWDGSWHALGQRSSGDGAIQGQVNALIATSTGVIAGGAFQNVADSSTDFLAEFNLDAFTWSDVHGSTNNIDLQVLALYQSGSDLYVGGDFIDAFNITTADYFIQWNGSQWIAPGGGSGESAIKSRVYSIVGSGSNVYVGGNFVNVGVAGGAIPTADRVAKWNGTSWSGLGSNGTNDGALLNGAEPPGYVRALALSTANLYAGGSFSNAANIPEADYIAAYRIGGAGNEKPDGRIKKGSGALVGNNIYNTTGVNQTRSGTATVGNTITFTISIQNDGTGAGKFSVASTASGNVNFEVKYFHGTTDITSAVVAGTYTTAKLPVGSKVAIKAKVKVLPAVLVGSPTNRLITITSTVNAAKVDAVKLTATRI